MGVGRHGTQPPSGLSRFVTQRLRVAFTYVKALRGLGYSDLLGGVASARSSDGVVVLEMKMAWGPFTLAQLARAVGMSFSEVRRFEAYGLLPPARRMRGQSSSLAYHKEHVDRLRFIGHALDQGFSVAAIQQLLDPNAELTCNDVFGIASRQLEERRQFEGPDDPAVVALEKLTTTCPRVGSRSDCRILATLTKPTATQKFHFRALKMAVPRGNGRAAS